MDRPRLRMFAGPNGSGKSTIKRVIPAKLLGVYLNPDEIEDLIRRNGFLNVRDYGVRTTEEEILTFFANSTLLQKAGLQEEASTLSFNSGQLEFQSVTVNSYFASVGADFLRQKLLSARISFSFETVMQLAFARTTVARMLSITGVFMWDLITTTGTARQQIKLQIRPASAADSLFRYFSALRAFQPRIDPFQSAWDIVTSMKTTVNVADDLFLRSKQVCKERGMTFRELFSEGLQYAIEKWSPKPPARVQPVTFKGEGLSREFAQEPWAVIRDAAYRGHR